MEIICIIETKQKVRWHLNRVARKKIDLITDVKYKITKLN